MSIMIYKHPLKCYICVVIYVKLYAMYYDVIILLRCITTTIKWNNEQVHYILIHLITPCKSSF
jgi:hypothetical protein